MAKLIYVASSWKNDAILGDVHAQLRAAGFDTWDFREHGFSHEVVDPKYLKSPHDFIDAPESRAAFAFDMRGLDSCDAGLVVLPAGVSTALEAGYIAGRNRPVVAIGWPRETRLDVMWRLAWQVYPGNDVNVAVCAFLDLWGPL